ncbi:YtxH domain-containing protein [Jiulongibacter sp. NS-SX5]|uniref:YtxH domain-containing protein n=1 Tax=Jiulongibacter sp. NS-SX5 TaxID=3463854 RepID=UPI004059C02B
MNKSMYVVAGALGFIAGVLYAPDKGRVSRLKLKRNANKLANKAIAQLENLESEIKNG